MLFASLKGVAHGLCAWLHGFAIGVPAANCKARLIPALPGLAGASTKLNQEYSLPQGGLRLGFPAAS